MSAGDDSPVHIDVCVCTCRRPQRLERLLHALQRQQTGQRFVHTVVVVDNDPGASAEAVVRRFAAQSLVPVRYGHEPVPNIAAARNHACALARGSLVAMIDDDEWPQEDWLLKMLQTLVACRADGVLGPVLPHYEAPPPQWVLRGGFCERPHHPTGKVLTQARSMRTGNLLIRRAVLLAERGPFDRQLGRSGGEDTDFFRRRLARGDTYVWCDEAPVWEAVPAQRLTRRWFLRRALLRGSVNGLRTPVLSRAMLRSALAALAYTSALPLLAPWRHDLFMQALVRDCDHLGRVFAACGLPLLRERGA